MALNIIADDSQIHILEQISSLNSLLDPTAYSASLLVVFPISVDVTLYFYGLRQKPLKLSPVLSISPPHPIPSESCQLYLQNAFRIQPFLTIAIAITLVCATIICHLGYRNSFPTGFLAPMLTPYTLIPTQQSGDLLKHRLEHSPSLLKTSHGFHFTSP